MELESENHGYRDQISEKEKELNELRAQIITLK